MNDNTTNVYNFYDYLYEEEIAKSLYNFASRWSEIDIKNNFIPPPDDYNVDRILHTTYLLENILLDDFMWTDDELTDKIYVPATLNVITKNRKK